MFERLQEVMVFVDDLAAARAWYARLVGSEPEIDRPGVVAFRVGPNLLVLHPSDAKSPVSSGGQVAYWRVADLAAAIDAASELGATLHRGPGDVPEDGIRICQMRDPFGSVFGMLEER
jgi:predicted enzyme related to lactoylglutathione lyase